jgi:hypothetical protein
MRITTTRTIYNPKNEKVFDFPADTILDNIILDLWNHIAKYLNHHFVVGDSVTIYPGYRPMRKDEFNAKELACCNEKELLVSISQVDIETNRFLIDGNHIETAFGIVNCRKNNDDKIIYLTVGIFGLMEHYMIELIRANVVNSSPYYTLLVPDIKLIK